MALDEKTGAVLWTQSWTVDYRGMSYGYGPRATPTVDGDRVYFAGAAYDNLPWGQDAATRSANRVAEQIDAA